MASRKLKSACVFVASVAAGFSSHAVQAASVGNVNDTFLKDVETVNTVSYGNFTYGYSDTTSVAGNLSGFTTAAYHPTSGGFDGTVGLDGFYVPNNILVPAIVGNTNQTSSVVTPYHATVLSSQLLLHPGGVTDPDGYTTPYSAADIRYTVPVAGTYFIQTAFSQLDSGNTDDGVYINGKLATSPLSATSSPAGPSFLNVATLNPGDTIDIVAAAHDGVIGSASTGLFANISNQGLGGGLAVPLPPAVYGGASVAGLAALSSFFRRRSRTIA